LATPHDYTIDIEPLGILEHVLTCKLGTDAIGLIPKIGKKLKKTKFVVFNPEKLLSIGLSENNKLY
jgi:hypothetical protein